MTKKEILTTVGSNLTLKDKKLCIGARNPFFLMLKSTPDDEDGNKPIEPKTTLQAIPKTPKPANFSTKLGHVDDVRTLTRRHRHIVRSVYHFFERRASCGCEECRDEFFNSQANLARRKKRRRWNSLPESATKCVLKVKKWVKVYS